MEKNIRRKKNLREKRRGKGGGGERGGKEEEKNNLFSDTLHPLTHSSTLYYLILLRRIQNILRITYTTLFSSPFSVLSLLEPSAACNLFYFLYFLKLSLGFQDNSFSIAFFPYVFFLSIHLK